MKRHYGWKYRKQGDADIINPMPCGCKVNALDGFICRFCPEHLALDPRPTHWARRRYKWADSPETRETE